MLCTHPKESKEKKLESTTSKMSSSETNKQLYASWNVWKEQSAALTTA